MDVRLQVSNRDQLIATLGQFATTQSVQFSGKNKVLVHGQLVIKRKFLRHVADHLFDRLGFPHDIMTTDARGALARLKNSAQHPDYG